MSPAAVVRSDPGSGFRSLVNDRTLDSMKVTIELGEAKNINKNPVAEKAIEELRSEIVRIQPLGGKVSQATLASAVSNLNSRIRGNKLSAFEIWTQREMTSGTQLKLDDDSLIKSKIETRISHHESSSKYKGRGKTSEKLPDVKVGDIVYLYIDRNKSKSRDKYLVVNINAEYAYVQKFVGKQLRAREYKVRISDIITVQSDPIPEVFTDPVPIPENTAVNQEILKMIDNHSPTTAADKPVYSAEFRRRRVQKPKRKPLQPVLIHPIDESSSDDSDYQTYSQLLETSLSEPPQIIDHEDEVNATVRGRPTRNKRLPAYLQDYHRGSITPLPASSEDDLNDTNQSEDETSSNVDISELFASSDSERSAESSTTSDEDPVVEVTYHLRNRDAPRKTD